jgi:DNA-binding NtrC family response regulator
MLEQLGFEVRATDGGRSALAAFREDPDGFALVLVDVTMPDMSGDQVFRELRKIRPDVKVVLASGHSQQELVSQFAGKGLAGILQKPFTLETLRSKLEAALA